MQQRRGTASQWTTANPILNAGEIGFESDTNKFKIGDGTNHWADLTYFVDGAELSNIIDGAPDLLNTLNELASAIGDDPAFFTTVATNLSNHEADTTNIHGINDTAELATKTFAAELLTNATKSNITITGDKNGLTITAENGVADSTTDDLAEGSTNKYFSDELAQDAVGNNVGTGLSYNDSTGAISVDTTTIQERVTDVSDTEIGYLNGVTSAIQTQLDDKAPLASPTFTGTTNAADVIISGDLTVSGTTTTVNAEDLIVADPLIYIGEGNTANLVDLGLVASFDDGTYQHSGLVRDSSAGTWKLFKGVTDEPTTTINFAQGSLDDLAVSALSAEDITSIDATFTGTVSGITSTMVGLGNVENTALSTWAGTSNITTLGTVATGTWDATTIATTKGGTGLTGFTAGDMIYASDTDTLAKLAKGTANQVMYMNSAGTAPEWRTAAAGAAFSELMLIGA